MNWMENKRLLLFFIWLIAYGLVISIYLSIVNEDFMPWVHVWPLLKATSAVILAQLVIMAGVIFGVRDKTNFYKTYKNRKYASLAYWLSVIYITLCVGFVFFGFGYPILQVADTVEANDMILKIMGILGIIVNAPVAYLFGKKAEEKEL